MKPEIKKIHDLAKKCQASFSLRKAYEEVALLSNFSGMLENEGDDMSPDSLVRLSRVVANTMKISVKLGSHDGSLIEECESVVQEMKSFEQVEIRNHFNALIGIDNVKTLENKYKVNYDTKDVSIYKTNEIEMCFIETDNVGDLVNFFSICYNFDEQAFSLEDCASNDKWIKTYEDVKAHNKSNEKAIINNNFTFVDLP